MLMPAALNLNPTTISPSGRGVCWLPLSATGRNCSLWTPPLDSAAFETAALRLDRAVNDLGCRAGWW